MYVDNLINSFMIISHKYKFIFIKTRKTAGSSIEWFLQNYLGDNDISTGSRYDGLEPKNIKNVDGHVGWEWIQKHYPNEWNTYYKFAVERNPWDLMVSKFYWYKKIKPHKSKRGFEFFVNYNAGRLNDWCKYAKKSQVVVDEVVKYENLHKWFSDQNIVPYDNELLTTYVKRSNNKEISSYRELYNKPLIKLIKSEYNKQIKLLKYSF
jgi:hypothetical protein